jgi:hypothetical protein
MFNNGRAHLRADLELIDEVIEYLSEEGPDRS